MNNILLVFLGGGLGSLARFGISEIVKENFKAQFPIATLCSKHYQLFNISSNDCFF